MAVGGGFAGGAEVGEVQEHDQACGVFRSAQGSFLAGFCVLQKRCQAFRCSFFPLLAKDGLVVTAEQ